ncbi:MAG: (d)CMP kinase [Ignavibacteriaceae bacterium]|nr:(d)CMP kinase [Ignavibacteriaceae bacterium]
MQKKLIVAIDGPAGSGKSTTAKLLAQRLNYLYIDTGAMYRTVTLFVIRKNILGQNEKIIQLSAELDIVLEFIDGETNVTVSGEDVSQAIRTYEVNQNVSDVSKIEGVRKILVQKQQEIGKNGGVVMEGRDITTVVFPNADVKIFLTAVIDERAKRRALEFAQKGTDLPINEVKENLQRRDTIDSNRKVSPLTQSPDAIEVDTSNVSIDEQVSIILDHVKRIAKEKNIKVEIN